MSAAKSDEGKPTADATPLIAWPNLKYFELGTLDYMAPVFDQKWFLDAATLAESLSSRDLRMRHIAEGLRYLADVPSVIKAANHRRIHTPARVIGLWRALHCLVSFKLYPDEPRSKVLGIVADIWGAKDRTIEADIGEHRTIAKKELAWLVKHEAKRSGRSKPSAKDRQSVIAAVDRDLKIKAAQEPKRILRTARKVTRKK